MKRSPLRRLTPLQSRSELRRGTPLQRGGPLNPVSDKRRRDCARCGRRDLPVHGHELIGRTHDSQAFLSPEALLDPICNGWCEDNPLVAAWTGWKLSTKWPHDPALQPYEARRLDGVIVDLRTLYAVEYEETA